MVTRETCNGCKNVWHFICILSQYATQPSLKRQKLDGSSDFVEYYASANMWQLQGQKMHFGAYLTSMWPWPLTFWPQNLTRLSLPRSPLLMQVWSNPVNKYVRYLANNVCSGRTYARTLWKHNASGHYVGGSINMIYVKIFLQRSWLKGDNIALNGKPISELGSVTCHTGSHSVTCHLIQVNAPRLNPSQIDWYSIYLPMKDGRLSWHRWLVTYRDSLPARKQSPIAVLTGPGVQ